MTRPLLSPPGYARNSPSPFTNYAAPFPSLSSSAPLGVPASSAPRIVRSGAQFWRTAPYIDMLRRCGWPCVTHITQSCTSMLAFICIRRRRKDTLIVLELWCEPPAQSPPTSPILSLDIDRTDGWVGRAILVFNFPYLYRWTPIYRGGSLFIGVCSLTSRLISAVY